MNPPLQVGITGGIGSGKSLVAKIFDCLGVPVYDADGHAKGLMTTDGILISEIKKEFGELSYKMDGSLNRDYLSTTVFNDPARLQILNELVHPRVAANYMQWVAHKKGFPYVLKEAALIFEAGSDRSMDKVIVVYAPPELRRRRVLSRDTYRTPDQVLAIMKNQMPDEEKIKRADFTVMNDETVLLIPQILNLHHHFISMHSR